MTAQQAGPAPPATETVPEETPGPPDPVERGRYAVFVTPDGKLAAIARAFPLCERCSSCECGEQQEPLTPQSMLSKAMEMISAGGGKVPGPFRALMAMVSRNGGS